ncbi:MAG: hypothetical protein ABI670_03390 [Chloroflexota bacterium]
MSLYYPIPQPTIATNILVRRERRLPVPGEVMVKAGQRVEPTDVIAQSMLTSEPVRIDIAADLDMSPQATAKRLQVSTGARVEQGSVLAQRAGTGSRASRSPVAGTFTGYDQATGTGVIAIAPEPVSVRAHLKGIVADLIPYYGAILETPATLVRGIFGIGGEQHGVLKVAVPSGDEPLTPGVIDARVAYAIVLGGSEVSADALRRMIELGARGLITGSIRSSELANFLGFARAGEWRMGAATAENGGWDFPPSNPGVTSPVPPDFVLIITEGFGSAPMSARTFETIAAYDGQEIAIDGTTRLRGGLARPEIIIPLARTTSVRWLEEKGPKLEVGTNVRLLSSAYLGQVAQVTGLPVGPRASQSGVIAPVADVLLSGGRRLRVPVVDIEVLE